MAIHLNPAGAGGLFPEKRPLAGSSEAASQFQEEMMRALAEVNQQINQAGDAGRSMLAGQVNDVSQVMIESTKAQLALELTIQLRNKVLESYQEIMRMQV